MGRHQTSSTMKAVFVLSIFISQSFGVPRMRSLECPPPPMPAECRGSDIRCDMGSYAGCWMGDYCMPEGYICPIACHTPAPAMCGEGEILCDMGIVDTCWLGNYCMPQGSECPPAAPATGPSPVPTVCKPPMPSNCSTTDISCDMGTFDGCWMGDYCMPVGSVCPPTCHTPAPAMCEEGEILCDMGIVDTCWMGNYCMPQGSECPP